MMNFKQSKLRPQLKIADDYLLDIDTSANIEYLEEMMELRGKPIEAHIKKSLKR